MLDKIFTIDSHTIRGLLLAIVGVLGLILSYFGVDATTFGAQAAKMVDALLLVFTTGGILWAAYARLFMPTPPLTDTAAVKRDVLVAKQAGTSVDSAPIAPAATTPMAKTVMTDQGGASSMPKGFTTVHFLVTVVALAAVALVAACANVTRPDEVISTACVAGTYQVERCAKATAEVYGVYQKQGLVLVQAAGTPAAVKATIKAIDAKASPIVHDILITAADYVDAKAAAADPVTDPKVVNLTAQLATSQTQLAALTAQLKPLTAGSN